jgi:predicted O-linked N-acetylglucosamine transferase (SPINDLY family)
VAGSLLAHLGLENLVASQLSEYVQIAVELGENEGLRNKVRRKLSDALEEGRWAERSSEEFFQKIKGLSRAP